MRLRHVHSADYDPVLAVIDSWWGGRPMGARLSHVFFTHFAPTSFVLENDAELVGFLLGFLSQTHPEEAYVHFIGIHPGSRRLGLGRRLYERFFVAAQMHGRCCVRSITAPSNQLSIAFHRSLGFAPLHGDVIVDGLPVWFDYAGAGGHRVVFRRQIAPEYEPALPGSVSEHGGSSQEGLDRVLASWNPRCPRSSTGPGGTRPPHAVSLNAGFPGLSSMTSVHREGHVEFNGAVAAAVAWSARLARRLSAAQARLRDDDVFLINRER